MPDRLEILDDIIKTIKKRKRTFGKAVAGFALSREEGDVLKVGFGYLDFFPKDREIGEDGHYDYGDFILVIKYMGVEEAIKIIDNLLKEQTVQLHGLPQIKCETSIHEFRFLEPRSNWGILSYTWPRNLASLDISNQNFGKIPIDPISKLELPLFPNGVEAINHFLKIQLPEEYYSYSKKIEIIVPDYRARIKEVQVSGKKINLKIETDACKLSDIGVKIFTRGKKMRSFFWIQKILKLEQMNR